VGLFFSIFCKPLGIGENCVPGEQIEGRGEGLGDFKVDIEDKGDLMHPGDVNGDFIDGIGDFLSSLMLSVLTLTVSWSNKESAVSLLVSDILRCLSFLSFLLFLLSLFELLDEFPDPSESLSRLL
jgi:hypothetical protein